MTEFRPILANRRQWNTRFSQIFGFKRAILGRLTLDDRNQYMSITIIFAFADSTCQLINVNKDIETNIRVRVHLSLHSCNVKQIIGVQAAGIFMYYSTDF